MNQYSHPVHQSVRQILTQALSRKELDIIDQEDCIVTIQHVNLTLFLDVHDIPNKGITIMILLNKGMTKLDTPNKGITFCA